jgi:hypothetical protein
VRPVFAIVPTSHVSYPRVKVRGAAFPSSDRIEPRNQNTPRTGKLLNDVVF